MAKKKTPARSSSEKIKDDNPTRTAQSHNGMLRTNNIVAEHARVSDDLVAAHRHPSHDNDPPLI